MKGLYLRITEGVKELLHFFAALVLEVVASINYIPQYEVYWNEYLNALEDE